MEKVLLTVVLPVFEQAGGLSGDLPGFVHQLKRAEKQLGRIEVIFVDNASSNETVAVIETSMALFERAKLVRLPWSCGPATSARVGVSASSGEFIALASLTQGGNVDHLIKALALLEDADVVVCRSPLLPAARRPRGTVSARFGSAVHKRLADRLATDGEAREGLYLAALRASVARPLLTLLRSPELAFGAEARVVTSSMGLRIALLPTSPTADSQVAWSRGSDQTSIAALARDLARARSHRSRALKAGFLGLSLESTHARPAQPVESPAPRRAEG